MVDIRPGLSQERQDEIAKAWQELLLLNKRLESSTDEKEQERLAVEILKLKQKL